MIAAGIVNNVAFTTERGGETKADLCWRFAEISPNDRSRGWNLLRSRWRLRVSARRTSPSFALSLTM